MRYLSLGVLLILLAAVNCARLGVRKEGSDDCGVRYEKVCQEGSSDICTTHQETQTRQECHTQHVRNCFTSRRSKRSPQLLQVILLAKALSARHPERAEEEREEVSCGLVPHTTCHTIKVCREVNQQHCSLQPITFC